MNQEHILSLCGGEDNLTRVLIDGDSVTIEVTDLSLSQFAIEQCDLALNQYTFAAEEKPDQTVCAALGRVIESNQRKKLLGVTTPVESNHRPTWHVSPPQGLLNDPNGFILHDGIYHLFYQWSPFECLHKDKYWAHLTSSDLVNWAWQPVALTPSDWFDSHGVFSGHALSVGDELKLFYTGNVRIGPERKRLTSQCVATSNDGVIFEKQGTVIAMPPQGVTEHIRDPKIVPYQDHYRMLLGAQTEGLQGRLAIYRSDDLQDWHYMGLMGQEFGDLGYMWECPDMFTLGEQEFVVIGPQGIESSSEYHTIPHHNGIAKGVWVGDEKLVLSGFEHLDHGFDFYAPQTAMTESGERVMSGWMGLPDEVDHPSADDGWVHQLTALRSLSFESGKLRQRPFSGYEQLRQGKMHFEDGQLDVGTKSFELKITLEWGSELKLFDNRHHHLSIRLDESTHTLLLDRSQTLLRDGDTVRELKLEPHPVELTILADTSSVEVFINDGEYVMTSRVFTPTDATNISVSDEFKDATLWKLAPASEPFKA
ncbi:glycoside hydrolase family 32 protein [Vibrio sp. SCSIO 43136]|uniref:glycoside hydrolase family 32 protein n=1 Tax=Vibrio sp. SCSIO 43136 TaxID=2819101 RepID=UPI0020754655|nr:glycoside hydrolase family 32 protein [Vibrio sp. SCSIO 43136]USD67945.1 glycoside hydrolase family 32 protein [Vibrio sp. SCSIO 43136]